MDPNETYRRMCLLALRILNHENEHDDNAVELAQLFDDINSWIAKGGFLPDAWTRCGREIRSLGQ